MSDNLLPQAPTADYLTRGATQDVDGYVVFDASQGSQQATFVFPTALTAGNAYAIDYDCSELSTSGGISFILAGGGRADIYATGSGPAFLRATSASTSLMVRALTGTVGKIKLIDFED